MLSAKPTMGVGYIILIVYLLSIQGSSAQRKLQGGEITTMLQHPYVSALLTDVGTGSYVQACTGTIIHAETILTAASCFYPYGVSHPVPAFWWRARVGSNSASYGGTLHLVRHILVHADYIAATRQHDIAILKTTFPIQFTEIVRPAPIVGAGFELDKNDEVIAVGFGDDMVLRAVSMWITDRDMCVNRYQMIGFHITEEMECAGWLDVGVRAQCAGDEGSPLLKDNALVGIFSWAQDCAGTGWFTGVNTKIAPYVNWIINATVSVESMNSHHLKKHRSNLYNPFTAFDYESKKDQLKNRHI